MICHSCGHDRSTGEPATVEEFAAVLECHAVSVAEVLAAKSPSERLRAGWSVFAARGDTMIAERGVPVYGRCVRGLDCTEVK